MKKWITRLFGQEASLNDQLQGLLDEVREMNRKLTQGGMVTFAEMANIPPAVDETSYLSINEGVRVYRLQLDNPDFLLFDTHMDPGSTFGVHRHDCIEFLWVLDGRAEVDEKTVTAYDSRTIDVITDHLVTSDHGCRLLVGFHRHADTA